LTACFSAPLRAQQPMTPAPMAPAQATPAPAKAAAVVPVPDSLGRYGKILTLGDQTAHPLKLRLPFPNVGEIKVPNKDELNMRDKLEQLAKLSDAEIHNQLEKWPAYGKMSLRDQGTMLQRIQDFRDYRTKVALGKAHDIGLLTLTPDQKIRFEGEYWDKQLQVDRDLAKQFEPILRAREQKLQDELFREFSSADPGPRAQPLKPPVKKLAQASASVAQAKATPSTNSSLDPASPQPMAQTPR
jgi:hypothetical protein